MIENFRGLIAATQAQQTERGGWFFRVQIGQDSFFTKFFDTETIPKGMKEFYQVGDEIAIDWEAEGRFKRILNMRRIKRGDAEKLVQAELTRYIGEVK